MKSQIISETPISLQEIKSILEKAQERDKELNFRAQKTIEYLQQTSQSDDKKAKELVKKLTDLSIPRMREQHIFKLAAIAPTNVKDVKTVLQGYSINLTNEQLKKVADTIAEVVKA